MRKLEKRWAIFLITWLISIVYVHHLLNRGWVPHDEGAFAQSAERVLNGEVPHRDFDELYTGGLTYLHALAFRILGANLPVMRLVLLAVFVLWVPAVFYVASRFLSLYASAAITLLCVAWSVPNYSAAVPSWYNLFLGFLACAALMRYLEAGSRWWLFTAGVCSGLSIIVKVAGIYFVAATILFLLFREQELSGSREGEPGKRSLFYTSFLVCGLTVFTFGILRLVQATGASGLIYYMLPLDGLAVVLIGRDLAGSFAIDRARFDRLASMAIPFGCGVAIPTAAFLTLYVPGFVQDFLYRVFVLPATRVEFAASPLPNPFWIFAAIPVFVLAIVAGRFTSRDRAILGAVALSTCTIVFVLSAQSERVYRLAWNSFATAIPVIVLAGGVVLGVNRLSRKVTAIRRQQVMLLISATGLMALVQFPFAAPIYFCYVAPMAIVAAAGVISCLGRPPNFVHGLIVAFYLFFAVLRVTPGFIYFMGLGYAPDIWTKPIAVSRAEGLRVRPSDAGTYAKLIPLVQEHAKGSYVYAGPDCPEVYFLSGLKNPTRMLFEFLDSAPATRTTRILDALERRKVNVVTINGSPSFSGKIPVELRKALEERYPNSARVGEFQVRWNQ